MAGRRGSVRTSRERLSRSEPFEVFTRPQRSLPARIVGLVIRLRAELLIAAVAVAVWLWLTDRMPTWAASLILAALVLAVGIWPPSRRYVLHPGYAVMTRHRLRAVCVERRVMNYSGNVPLLLWCRPTAVGERVWVLLRAGIDAADIERNLSHIGSTCWAADARVTPHRRVAALVVIDVVRRDPLTGRPHTSPHARPDTHPHPNPAPAPAPALPRRLTVVGDDQSA